MRFLFCFSLCFLACNQIKVKVMRNKKHPSNWFTAVGFARIEEWVGEVEEYGRRKRNEEERLLYWRLKFSDVEFSTFLSFDMVAGIDLVCESNGKHTFLFYWLLVPASPHMKPFGITHITLSPSCVAKVRSINSSVWLWAMGRVRWVSEGGRWARSWQNILPSLSEMSESGRMWAGWSNASPKVRWVMEWGNLSTGWLKFNPNVRWVSEHGRRFTGCWKWFPNLRCVNNGGSESTDWLKSSPNSRYVSRAGRKLAAWLNLVPKVRWVSEFGSVYLLIKKISEREVGKWIWEVVIHGLIKLRVMSKLEMCEVRWKGQD